MTDDSPTSEKRPYVHILRNVSPGPLLDIAARWHCPHLPPGSEVSEMLLGSRLIQTQYAIMVAIASAEA